VEALSGSSIPNGCFIGVRVGEVLKQGRYDPSCCYRFPALERQRNAKIDLYQHLGTCSALVDPEAKANNEVKVSGPADIRLKISTRPDASKPREERKTEVKKQAKDYLGRHRIEERLCTAVKALLASQPEDPTEFLVTHLRDSCDKAPPAEPAVQPTTDAEDPELAQAAVKIQAVQRGKKERQTLEQVRREKEEAVQASSAAPAAQSGQPTSDAEDPELAQAAVKIQAVQRGKKERQELQQVRREKAEAVEAQPAAPTEQSDQPTTDADDPELALAAVKIQAVQRGKKERQELQQIRREKGEAVAATAAGAPPEGAGTVLEDNRFQAYYSKNIGRQMTPSSWNALYAMFPRAS